MLTTFAIVVHELPHEISDFAILLRADFDKWSAVKAQVGNYLVLVRPIFIIHFCSKGKSQEWSILQTHSCYCSKVKKRIKKLNFKETHFWVITSAITQVFSPKSGGDFRNSLRIFSSGKKSKKNPFAWSFNKNFSSRMKFVFSLPPSFAKLLSFLQQLQSSELYAIIISAAHSVRRYNGSMCSAISSHGCNNGWCCTVDSTIHCRRLS